MVPSKQPLPEVLIGWGGENDSKATLFILPPTHQIREVFPTPRYSAKFQVTIQLPNLDHRNPLSCQECWEMDVYCFSFCVWPLGRLISADCQLPAQVKM